MRTAVQHFTCTHIKTQNNSCFLLLNLLFSIRQALDLPDALSLLEEAEGAQDPLFGVMQMQDATLSPSTLIKVHMHKHKQDRRQEI